jgi:CRP-like cAMP-binding protein
MITPSDILHVPLLTAMAHPLRSRIVARAADIAANAGEWIANDGDPAYFWILLEGEVEAVKLVAGQTQQVTTFDPGEYFGEVPLMLTTTSFTGLRALVPSRLMRVDPADFHAMVTESSEASAILAQTLVRRVNFIKGRRRSSADATTSHVTISAIFFRAIKSNSNGSIRPIPRTNRAFRRKRVTMRIRPSSFCRTDGISTHRAIGNSHGRSVYKRNR